MPQIKPAPSFKKINLSHDPAGLYRAIRRAGPGVLLESARVSSKLGRYSLVGTRPECIFQYKQGRSSLTYPGKPPRILSGNPIHILQKILRKERCEYPAGGPPFAGGAVGFVGYESKKLFEPSLTQLAKEDLGLPWMYFIILRDGVLFDHQSDSVFLFSSEGGSRKMQTLENELYRHLEAKPRPFILRKPSKPLSAGLKSSVSRREFIQMVLKAKEHIRRGDIYQANLSQRFSFPLTQSVDAVYEKLKQVNPSAFFGILDAGDFQIISGSPERLLKLEGRALETRPIAGTRSRGKSKKEDNAGSVEFLLNEKERAEHVMLLDLERNDLGRVAEYGSVTVDELMTLEQYSHVKHIVSNVRATLRDGLDAVDAFSAFFPGGTITGAPKVRSMQVIDELEPVARGPYTGSLGYFSFTGDMDFNIIIRSLVIKDGMAHLQVGAGIVADSDPGKEYDETLYKAEAVLTAIFGPVQTRSLFSRLRAS